MRQIVPPALVVLALPLLAACAPPPGAAGQEVAASGREAPAAPTPSPQDLASCNGGAYADAIGRFLVHGATGPDEVNQDRLPRPHRVLTPDTAVTMDYRPDRLTIEVDRAGRILAVRCG